MNPCMPDSSSVKARRPESQRIQLRKIRYEFRDCRKWLNQLHEFRNESGASLRRITPSTRKVANRKVKRSAKTVLFDQSFTASASKPLGPGGLQEEAGPKAQCVTAEKA